jgi:hypothetical protein
LEGVEEIIMNAPHPDEVRIAEVHELKAQVERAAAGRSFKGRASAAVDLLGSNDELAVAKLRQEIDAYTRARIGRDHTATGIAGRLGQTSKHIRWKSGCADLDFAFRGVGPDGQPGDGLLAQGEILVLAAQYGGGKTRIVNNWVVQLLEQGASVAMVALEDDDVSFATRLIAIKENVEPWKIEQFATGACVFLGAEAAADTEKCERGLAWWRGLEGRLRIYDGNADLNIFDYRDALELMQLDRALYKTTHTIIDYVTAWPGDTQQLEAHAYGLRAFAARNEVGLIEIAQLANDTIKFGSAPGQVAAKGSGAWGAAAHIGIELFFDPSIGHKEVGLAVKKARNAARQTVYAELYETTGKVKCWKGTSDYLDLPTAKKEPAKKGGRK